MLAACRTQRRVTVRPVVAMSSSSQARGKPIVPLTASRKTSNSASNLRAWLSWCEWCTQDPARNVKAVPAGEERQNAIADAIVHNAGAKLDKMPAKQVLALHLTAHRQAAFCDKDSQLLAQSVSCDCAQASCALCQGQPAACPVCWLRLLSGLNLCIL